MELDNVEILGIKGPELKSLFEMFLNLEADYRIEDGFPKLDKKIFDCAFVEKGLNIDSKSASEILVALIEQDYIDRNSNTPTSRGVALAHANGLPRIPLSQAECYLIELIELAKEINLRTSQSVFIKEILLFGSVKERKTEVGDVDLLVIFGKPEGDSYLPEHLDEEEDLCEELQNVSPYLSFHGEFDQVVANADKESVYKKT